MKKIMFSDRYGLTEAVLNGIKTQTRRIAKLSSKIGFNTNDPTDEMKAAMIDKYSRYSVGEVVAIAQSYINCAKEELHPKYKGQIYPPYNLYDDVAGWKSKMFVKADLMPHHIKITNVRIERLQDISDSDCLTEGIIEDERYAFGKRVVRYGYDDSKNMCVHWYNTPKEAFASLIDATSGQGTYDSNPYVYVYDFVLFD